MKTTPASEAETAARTYLERGASIARIRDGLGVHRVEATDPDVAIALAVRPLQSTTSVLVVVAIDIPDSERVDFPLTARGLVEHALAKASFRGTTRDVPAELLERMMEIIENVSSNVLDDGLRDRASDVSADFSRWKRAKP